MDVQRILEAVPRADSGWLARTLDGLLPPTLVYASAEAQRRGRILVVTALVLASAAAFFCWQVSVAPDQPPYAVPALVVGSAAAIATFPVVWLTGSLAAAGVYLAALNLTVLYGLAYVGGGVSDPSLWWAAVTPLIAGFTVSPRAAFLTAGAAAAGSIGLFGLEQGHVRAFPPPDASMPWFSMLCSVSVFFAIAGIAWVYESSRRSAFALVEATLRHYQSAHDDLQGANAELRAARDAAFDESRRRGDFIEQMRGAARAQGRALEETRVSTAGVSSTIRTIAASVDTLASSATSSTAVLKELDATFDRTTQSIKSMVLAVEETGNAIHGSSGAVSLVSERFDGVKRAAEATMRRMSDMDASAGKVEEIAKGSTSLSDDVIRDAALGQEAVRRALEGMGEIRARALVAGQVIQSLGAKTEAIGTILHVIDEVAVETNVLALNASIIAAQAGEGGQAFTVVASQIKALAERSATSSREIAALIAAVQDEAKNAVGTMAEGEQAIASGVSLSQDAAAVLAQIVDSTTNASRMVRAIAGATVEQAGRARVVANEMAATLRLVEEAVRANEAQAQAATKIVDTTARMRASVPELQRASAQQADGVRKVHEAISRIQAMAVRLGQVQGEQTKRSEETLRSIEQIHAAQLEQVHAIDRLTP